MNAENSKKGALIAGIALVVVLVVGAVAYGVLSAGRNAGAGDSSVSGSSVATSSTSATSVTGDGGATGEANDASNLADYDATVYTYEGEQIRLSQIANSRPLVINFWATWCPYCVKEMPDYLQIYKEYGDRVSFAFIDDVGGRGETVEGAHDWLSSNGFAELPAYYDNDLDASSVFGVRSLPTTVVVAADGKIVSATAGSIDPDRMRSLLDGLV